MSICCFNFHHVILILWRLLVSVRWYVGLWGFVPVGIGYQEHAAVSALVPLSAWSRKVGILWFCILFPYRGRKFLSWAGRCIGWTELCLDGGSKVFSLSFEGFALLDFAFLFYFYFFLSPEKNHSKQELGKNLLISNEDGCSVGPYLEKFSVVVLQNFSHSWSLNLCLPHSSGRCVWGWDRTQGCP